MLAQAGMSFNPKIPSKWSILNPSPITKKLPIAIWTKSFLTALIPTMSSFSPMKNTGMDAPKTPSHLKESHAVELTMANETNELHSTAANNITPPTVGTDR